MENKGQGRRHRALPSPAPVRHAYGGRNFFNFLSDLVDAVGAELVPSAGSGSQREQRLPPAAQPRDGDRTGQDGPSSPLGPGWVFCSVVSWAEQCG